MKLVARICILYPKHDVTISRTHVSAEWRWHMPSLDMYNQYIYPIEYAIVCDDVNVFRHLISQMSEIPYTKINIWITRYYSYMQCDTIMNYAKNKLGICIDMTMVRILQIMRGTHYST